MRFKDALLATAILAPCVLNPDLSLAQNDSPDKVFISSKAGYHAQTLLGLLKWWEQCVFESDVRGEGSSRVIEKGVVSITDSGWISVDKSWVDIDESGSAWFSHQTSVDNEPFWDVDKYSETYNWRIVGIIDMDIVNEQYSQYLADCILQKIEETMSTTTPSE